MHELQFEFTAGGGCEKAVFVLKSVVEYFVEHGSSVYLAALDISKAYDRVDHRLLLLKLINIGIAYDIVFVCWYWFKHLFGVVDWQGHLSAHFAILSGVRQGGNLLLLVF